MNQSIDKAVWQLFETSKDIAKKNLVSAVSTGQLKVDEEALPALLNLVSSSIDEGFSKGHKAFLSNVKKVDQSLTKKKK